MIQMIAKENRLKAYLHHEIADAGVTVSIDPALEKDDYIGIKVDDYYAGLHLQNPPKSVDFIVAVDCECDWYTLYVLELKNVSRPSLTKDIQEKFTTAIDRFMGKEFKDIFCNDRFKYRNIYLYLVTTAYKKAVEMGSFEQYQKLREATHRRDSLSADDVLAQKLYRFRGIICSIRREIPPNPVIRKET